MKPRPLSRKYLEGMVWVLEGRPLPRPAWGNLEQEEDFEAGVAVALGNAEAMGAHEGLIRLAHDLSGGEKGETAGDSPSRGEKGGCGEG